MTIKAVAATGGGERVAVACQLSGARCGVGSDDLFDDLGFGGQDDILEVNDAFHLSTDIEGNSFVARWIIAEGHYLYQNKMEIIPASETSLAPAISLSSSVLPVDRMETSPARSSSG